jgi:hypothetical protein
MFLRGLIKKPHLRGFILGGSRSILEMDFSEKTACRVFAGRSQKILARFNTTPSFFSDSGFNALNFRALIIRCAHLTPRPGTRSNVS